VTGWSDVDDYGRPGLRDAWRRAPDDPPLLFATTVDVPIGLAVDGERDLSECR